MEPLATAHSTVAAAMERAVYLLDRELAPGSKVRAFQRAAAVLAELPADELRERAAAGTLADLEGVGPSTARVAAEALAVAPWGPPDGYLAALDERSAVPVGVGGPLRELLRGDCHLHTTWSDGAASVRAMAETARSLGHEYLVVTDHSARLTVAHGLDEARLVRQIEEIEALDADLEGIRVLTGMEVDILGDGSLDLSEELLGRLDLVVASVHSAMRMPSEAMTRRLVLAAANPHVDVIGHITNRKLSGGGRPPSTFDAELVLAACARFGTAVEINCRPERQDPPEELLELAVAWECDVVIDTDAHAPGQLEWQAYGCDKAIRCGVPTERILNTRSADDLLAWTAAHGPTAA
jgi:putative hydrolase